MRALVTNDDGITSPGIAALARAAESAGLEVVVAAPAWDSSGASASITAVHIEGEPKVDDFDIPTVSAASFAVHGSPAYIVRAASNGTFGATPDVVLSGINAGANTGRAILHSGTVGAALTAISRGCSGAAFSIDSARPRWMETAAVVATNVIRGLMELATSTDGPVALNVNIPDRPVDDLVGFIRAPLAPMGSARSAVTVEGRDLVQMTIGGQHGASAADDVGLLVSGYVTVTPLQPVCEAIDADIDDLVNRGIL